MYYRNSFEKFNEKLRVASANQALATPSKRSFLKRILFKIKIKRSIITT